MLLNIFLYAPPSPPSTNPLQDAGWVGVGVAILIGIATIVTTVVITNWAVRKQSLRKKITRQILSDLSIISKNPIAEESIGKQVENRLKIVFDGKPVDDLRLISLKIWNSGNVDAQIHNSKQTHTQQSDVETPIRFDFPGRQVVSGVVETEPSTGVIDPEKLNDYVALYLTPAPTTDGLFQNIRMHLPLSLVRIGNTNAVTVGEPVFDFVELPPCLLKPAQSIILRLLVIGSKGDIVKGGNLVDWKLVDFDPEVARRTISISSKLFYAIMCALGVVAFFIIFQFIGKPMDIINNIKGSIVGYINIFILFFIITFIPSIIADLYRIGNFRRSIFKW